MASLAPALAAIPVVLSTTDRTAQFPTPAVNQRVHNLATGAFERWDGAQWVRDIAIPSGSRTNTTVAGFLANNAVMYNVLDYAVPGTTPNDGVTDPTAAITAAVAACPVGGTVLFPPGTYKLPVSGGLTITKSVEFFGQGATIDGSLTGVNGTALNMTGTVTATTTTVTSQIAVGDTGLTVASTTGFLVGDMIQITSTQTFTVVDTSGTYKKGELAFIKSVDSSTHLTLVQAMKDVYSVTAQTITVTRIVPLVNPRVTGLTFVGSGVSTDLQIGCTIKYAVNPKIQGVTAKNFAAAGIDLDHCDHGIIDDCYGENFNDLVTATGYAFSFSGLCQFCTISNSHATKFRIGFTTGSFFPVWHWSVVGCAFSNGLNNVSAGVLTHNNASDGLIVGNTVENCAIGLNSGGQRDIIVGNVVTNATVAAFYLIGEAPRSSQVVGNRANGASGVVVNAYTGGTAPNVLIEGNVLNGLAVGAVAVAAGVTCQADYACVIGNHIRNHTHGIRCDGKDSVIKNNYIVDVPNSAMPSAMWAFTGSGQLWEGNVVRGDQIAAQYGIVVGSGATNARFLNNDMRGAWTVQSVSDSGTGSVFLGNRYTVGATAGKATLVAGTVTVSTSEVLAGDTIVLTKVTGSGAARGVLEVGTITAGTSFVINSMTSAGALAADTSTVFWQIIH